MSDPGDEESAGVGLDDDEHRWWGSVGAGDKDGHGRGSHAIGERLLPGRGDPRNPKG